MDGDEGRDSESLDELLPLRISGGLGCHHDDVDVLRGDDELVGDGETVGEVEGRTLLQVGLDELLVDVGLGLVGKEHQDDVCVLDGLVHGGDGHSSVLLGLLPGGSVLPDSDGDVKSGVAEAESLCASLCSVSENCDFLSLEDVQIRVLIMVNLGVHDNNL